MITDKKVSRAYYLFMILLPVVFYPNISDYVLLPRQLYLSVFLVCILIYVYGFKKIKNDKVGIDRLALISVFYFGVACISTYLKAKVPSESYYVISKQLIVFTFFFTTFSLLKNKIISSSTIVTSVLLFTIIAVLTALYDINSKLINGQYLLNNVHEIAGGFANKNLLASILFLCIPFLLIRLKSKSSPFKLKSVLLFFCITILLILRTRSALIGLFSFVVIILYFFFKNKYHNHKYWVNIITIGLPFILYFVVQKIGLIGSTLTSESTALHYIYRIFDIKTLSSRLQFWDKSLEMFWDNYLIGVGPGNWQIHFPKYGLNEHANNFDFVNGILTIQHPHNDLLWMLCETGVFGFVLFYSFIGIIIYRLLISIKDETDSLLKWNFIFLFSGIIGYLFLSFFSFPSDRIEHQVLFIILLAFSHFYSTTKSAQKTIFYLKSKLVLALGLSVVFYSGFVSFSRIKSECEMSKLFIAKEKSQSDLIIKHSKLAQTTWYEIDSYTVPLEWYSGNAYFAKKDYNISLIYYKDAYNKTPYGLFVINNLASCYFKTGDTDRAIEFYNKALNISANFEESLIQLSGVYYNNAQYDLAFKTIEKVDVKSKNKSYIPFLTAILTAKIYTVLRENKIERLSSINSNNDLIDSYFSSKIKAIDFEVYLLNLSHSTIGN